MKLAILQARTSSTRMPNKVLEPILGKPMLARQIERILRSHGIDRLVVATSTDPSDDPIEKLCRNMDVACYRGSLDDVLDRFYHAAQPYNPEVIIRLTGDCPLADPEVIDSVIKFYEEGGYDHVCNTRPPSFPDGLDTEVMSYAALAEAWREAKIPSQREHVTPYIKRQGTNFRLGNMPNPENLSQHRWTVDYPEDFAFVKTIYEELYPQKPNFRLADVVALLKTKPELMRMNSQYSRNEGYRASLKKDFEKRYKESLEMYERAVKKIPLGTQTFSKSRTQYPLGVSPMFIAKGKGSHVWDIDGNEFVDYVSSQAAITLGHGDPDVSAAVRAQLEEGVLFSLPHPLEVEVSELISNMVPSAEFVRFGKNGSDVTSAAVRLARAYTGRDRIATCGYHGWQDWYIGSTPRNRGVPKAVQQLTHSFQYNDLDSLQRLFHDHPGEFAGVIMEPMHGAFPKDDFLGKVKELTHANGALLIFDEIITGFRFSNGGAQKYFGVTPDLTALGKGMANGFPISAIAGKEEIMRLLEEVFFSFTFGGELLSLAAAKATLTKLQREPVIATLKERGETLVAGVQRLLEKHEMQNILGISGYPAWTFLGFKDVAPYSQFEIKTLFLQEVFLRGILTIGSHNINYSHSEEDVQASLRAYDEVFPIVRNAVLERKLADVLQAKPLENLFKIR